jgi:hypothetical protein
MARRARASAASLTDAPLFEWSAKGLPRGTLFKENAVAWSGLLLRQKAGYADRGLELSNAAIPSYLEIIDFIAAGTTPQTIVDYRPSLEAQQRVTELIAREKEGGLSPEEQSELDHFIDLEHILRMAKGRARQILISGS